MIDIQLFNEDVMSNGCYNISTKDGQANKGNNKTISYHQTLNGKHKDWVKARRFMDAYLYKEKNADGIPRSYVILIDKDKPDPVPIEDQNSGKALLVENNSSMTTRRSINPYKHGK